MEFLNISFKNTFQKSISVRSRENTDKLLLKLVFPKLFEAHIWH